MHKKRSARPSLAHVLTEYLERRADLSTDCAEQYTVDVNAFRKWLGREPDVRDFDLSVIRKFLVAQRDCGLAPRTVKNRRKSLLMLWKFADRHGWSENFPRDHEISEELPNWKIPKRRPIAWTLEQLAILRKFCESAPKLPKYGPALWDGRYWLSLVLLIWDTGHRLDCLLNCPRSALDERGILRMPAELTKSKVEQCHELGPDTIAAISSLPPHELLLPWPYTKRHIWTRFERDILIPAGLPHDSKRKFHCIRKSSASHLCALTDERTASNHLGHASVEITRASYLDPTVAYPERSAASVLPRF